MKGSVNVLHLNPENAYTSVEKYERGKIVIGLIALMGSAADAPSVKHTQSEIELRTLSSDRARAIAATHTTRTQIRLYHECND